jgi:mannose-6-phosphate isomerase-like protein (cupin superfamily)
MFVPLFLDMKKITISNRQFRKVIYESQIMRITIMSIKPNQEIGDEIHTTEDQFIKIESGEGHIILPDLDETGDIYKGESVIIPKFTRHNIKNLGNKPLKLYSIYSKVFNPYQ